MAHPIYQANENSPYEELTREEFYKKHQVLHRKRLMLNQNNMKIFTQSWSPDPNCPHFSPPKGLVAMVHGDTSESSWLFELTAVAIAKSGFHACALDLQGHGYSDGTPGHIPAIEPLVDDCIQFFDTVRSNHPNLPAFIFGESLGGAIAILITLKQGKKWNGLVVFGAMCGVSTNIKPLWPLEELLPLAAFFAPTSRMAVAKPSASRSYKEEWKRKLVARSPNRPKCGRPTAATAVEFLRVCKYIKRQCHGLEVPMLVLHGGDDRICDPNSAKFVYESAASEDKTLQIFEGMWHQFIGEPNESVQLVFGTILSWVEERAQRAKSS